MTGPNDLPPIDRALLLLAENFGREISPGLAKMLIRELEAYPEAAVLQALRRCWRECTRFPSMAEIIERIPDGRPGPEEAWAMIPKDEGDSVVWTEEMAEAYGTVAKLITGEWFTEDEGRPDIKPDLIAARKAFLEKYERLVADARAERKPAKWSAAFGRDPGRRQLALKVAVEKQRIPQSEAQRLLPDASPGSAAKVLQLLGPAQATDPETLLKNIRGIKEVLLKDADPVTRLKAKAPSHIRSVPLDVEEERKNSLKAQLANLRNKEQSDENANHDEEAHARGPQDEGGHDRPQEDYDL